MLSARALAEKSADMPSWITLWLAFCRSASVPARFVLRRGRIAEERGREQEGWRKHRSRAATLDLRSADTCFAHLHTGRSETRSYHRRTFYRTALGVSTAFECSS